MRLSILVDYQNVALGLADWPRLSGHCSVTAFDRPFRDVDDAAEALEPFDILCTMRARTALPGELLERLPHLKLITITGGQNRTLDLAAATRLKTGNEPCGVNVCHRVTLSGEAETIKQN